MFWQEDLEVQLHSYSMCHIDVWINNWLEDRGCFLARFYGHWNVSQRKYSWELIKRIGDIRVLAWCILGDFNELLFSHETISMVSHPEFHINHFQKAVDNLKLVEISMDHIDYTWWNKRSGENVV